jgi:hypothetical protein
MARKSTLSNTLAKTRKPPSMKGANLGSGREKGVNKALPKSLRSGKHRAKGH